jgi:hypothetical protein
MSANFTIAVTNYKFRIRSSSFQLICNVKVYKKPKNSCYWKIQKGGCQARNPTERYAALPVVSYT